MSSEIQIGSLCITKTEVGGQQQIFRGVLVEIIDIVPHPRMNHLVYRCKLCFPTDYSPYLVLTYAYSINPWDQIFGITEKFFRYTNVTISDYLVYKQNYEQYTETVKDAYDQIQNAKHQLHKNITDWFDQGGTNE